MKLKITLLGLATFALVYYIFLEIYFFSDWGEAEIIIPQETTDEKSLKEFFNWQALPILKQGKYVQQGSEQRDEQRGAKDYIFEFPLGVNFSVPDKYNPLRWPENDDALNFICLGKNSRVDLSAFFSDLMLLFDTFLESSGAAEVSPFVSADAVDPLLSPALDFLSRLNCTEYSSGDTKA